MKRTLLVFLLVNLVLSACAPGSAPMPTLAPSATLLPAPTFTSTPTPTPEPTPTSTPEPTPTPEVKKNLQIIPEELQVNLTEKQIETLSTINAEVYGKKGLQRFSSSEIIKKTGIDDLQLQELYRVYFDTEWKDPLYPETEYRGLGIYTGGNGSYLHSAVGLLYGFVEIKNVPQKVVDLAKLEGVEPRPLYLILQIRPGKNLTPEKDPDAFVAIKMGFHIYGGVNNTGFWVTIIKDHELKGKVVQRSIGKNRIYRGTDAWTVEEWTRYFGLKKGSIVSVTGYATYKGKAAASWFGIIMPEFPSLEIQQEAQFSLD